MHLVFDLKNFASSPVQDKTFMKYHLVLSIPVKKAKYFSMQKKFVSQRKIIAAPQNGEDYA